LSAATPIPRWKVTLDGRDLTGKLQPRLVELSVTSCRRETADQLDIRLTDHDGRLAIPPRGATLRVWLGWDVSGLVDMGTFTVDEVEHSGAPDELALVARSAHLKSSLRAQREQSWHDTTVGAIVDELAGRNSLTPRCHPTLRDQAIDHIDQTSESDINFLTRLGMRYDAVATIKAGALIFAPIGMGTTASGRPIPSTTIERKSGDDHRWHAAERGAYGGVRARYEDKGGGHTGDVLVGSDDGHGVKVLRTIYASKSNAMRAARSEFRRLQRGVSSFQITLAHARPELYPEMHLTVHGFKPEIDESDWLIKSVKHHLTDAGMTTQLELETKPAGTDKAPEKAA
jgi:phage protein D